MSLRRALLRDRLAVCSLLFLLLVLLAALLAPWLAPHDPLAPDVRNKFAVWSAAHWFGTDHLGRDVFSRLLYGARYTLGFALLTTALTLLAGILPGLLAGVLRGRTEALLLRLCDILLSFPAEVLILAVTGMLGAGPEKAALACLIAKWPWYARMMCGIARQYADTNAVRFARVMGHGLPHILRRHILPRVAGETIVLATLHTGSFILTLSALSFLGLGVQPPTPEWGAMLGEARNALLRAPWLMLPPGAAILLVVAACNYLGDCLHDALEGRCGDEGKAVFS